jgi:hypothetical protein
MKLCNPEKTVPLEELDCKLDSDKDFSSVTTDVQFFPELLYH